MRWIMLSALPLLVLAPPARTVTCPSCARMHAQRSLHTATRLPDGRVFIVGGMIRNGEPLASAEIFDQTSRSFQPTSSMPEPRFGHTATLLPTGQVLIAGGYTRDTTVLASALLYDPLRGTFAPTGPMAVARAAHSATLLPDGRVLIVGGENHNVATSAAELYDPTSGRFSPTGAMTVARAYHVAAPLGDGRVLVAGGGPDLHHVLASAEVFDEVTRTFARVGDMTEVRRKAAAVTLADGRVLVVGGADTRDWNAPSTTAEIYDPARHAFEPTGALHIGRFKLTNAVAVLPNGRVMIAGGGQGVELYNPATGRFSMVADRAARYYSTATTLSETSVLVAGGYGYGGGDSDGGANIVSVPPELQLTTGAGDR
jgi:hypothetical protein